MTYDKQVIDFLGYIRCYSKPIRLNFVHELLM